MLGSCTAYPAEAGAASAPDDESPAHGGSPENASKLAGFDEFIDRVMKEWRLPGFAVARVHDGKVIHAQVYGFPDVDRQLPVTPKPIFAIGSISNRSPPPAWACWSMTAS